MRKLNYLFFLLAVPAMITFTGCGSDDPNEDPEPGCGTETFPATTGTSSVSFANYPDNVTNDPNNDDIIDISAASGDVLAFAVEINKGTASGAKRPQKLRVYSTECDNKLGSIVNFSGTETIDLRNDDNQIRNVNYTVPSGVTSTYLNFEVDESGGKVTYKRVKLTVSGSGVVSEFLNVLLGDQGNSNASRMASATGLTYTACNSAGNVNDIDITYVVSKTAAGSAPNGAGSCATQTQNLSYITDNNTRFTCPIGLATSTITCGDDQLDVDGGPTVYFKTNTTSIEFADATDADLSALSVSSTTGARYVQITGTGQVIEFLTTNGRKGLIEVVALSSKNASGGTITINVKVQR